MREIPPLVDTKILRPAETALALNLVSEMDLLRLKTVARLYARGLPSDEELIEAAKDLGMNTEMRNSAAFAGLKYPAKPQLSDFFEFEVCRKLEGAAVPIAADVPMEPRRKSKRPKRIGNSTNRKNPIGK